MEQERDRRMLEEILEEQRAIADAYNACADRCGGGAVHTQMMSLLHEEHQIQHEIFAEIEKRGWYCGEQAGRDEIDRVKKKFAEEGRRLGLPD